jgi:DNA repair protein RecO (recombination protein O)
MMKNLKTQGIILNTFLLNEKDKLIILLTPDLGKIAIIAPSSNSLKCRLTCLIEKTNHLNLELYKKRTGYLLTDCKLVQSFRNIKKSLPLIISSEIALEIIDKMTPNEEPSPQTYQILKNFLDEINKQKKSKELLEIFKAKLLYHTGVLKQNENLDSQIRSYIGKELNYQKLINKKNLTHSSNSINEF